MWRSSRRWLALGLIALAAAANAQPMPGKVIDLASGTALDPAAFVQRVAAAERVLLGERHDIDADHEAERWLLQALHQKRPQGALVLEMIASERQPRLQRVQRWLDKGNRVESQRLAELLDWDPRWPWTRYGGLVQIVTDSGIRLQGSNLSRAEVNTLLASSPEVVFPADGARQRLSAVVLAQHADAAPMLDGMLAVQHARDTRMARMLMQSPAPALLVAGRWHVLRGTGVPGHLPTSAPVLVIVLASVDEDVARDDADLLWVVGDE
ncbi:MULTISPECIES: ChaN family lipoprotein [Stenotrophomonas]|uniref:ChaN family lipoprotein n=1 Tax=Stenotrophomonas lactitubi TaxID=2045214 RepID=A0AAW4GN45_9GAMM|nr:MULTISPECIES: ChaN family lipoprotein [Stenotrophomonas]MBM9915908.1 ChaN family lipoprotein [Stenotrophomonas lactitubi]MBM9921133.1 ChaN family lipoprotein [Stenotrophomonas lactitubi]MBM9940498.1 ChaN family lipoprotein [Stenotrophomonas lactitubi]